MAGRRFEEQDLKHIRTISIEERVSKVTIDSFVDPDNILSRKDVVFRNTKEIFPDMLAGGSLKRVVSRLHEAKEEKKEILWLIGAHVIKCGLSLYVRSLIDKGFITALATTGAATIHDLELAFYGVTSEDVAVELPAGRFGMSKETVDHFMAASHTAIKEERGLGEGIGQYITTANAPYQAFSIFSKAAQASIPATVHVAFGTDIVHQHPTFEPETVANLTMRDFRILSHTVGNLFSEGAVMVFGSAVVLPEVFLKAASINFNLGKTPTGVIAANFDMNHQYRVNENILTRPFKEGGESFSFTGHHEIMLPLLYFLLTE
jgi:hypothetical protein